MTTTNGTDVLTPVGRLVWGHPMRAQPVRDSTGKPRVNPETQQQVEQWAFGLAVPKEQCQPIFDVMNAQAAEAYPQNIPPAFAWKFVDGDGVDAKGESYSGREGYPGCFVFAFSTQFAAPAVYQRNSSGSLVQLTDDALKCGDYIRVSTNIRAHTGNSKNPSAKPGLYLNPNLVELIGYGEEIRKGPNPDQVFGQAATLPPGASSTPVASNPAPGAPQAPAVPGAPTPPTTATQQPPSATPAVPGTPPQSPTAPAQGGQPAVPGAPAPQAAYDFLQGPPKE